MTTAVRENYTGTRISTHSPRSFNEVSARLYGSIGSPSAPAWPGIARSLGSLDQDSFTTAVEAALGPHGFMVFAEFNHGAWIPLWGVGQGLQSKRVVLGNPLFAITMLKHDRAAGLAVPVELLLLEDEDRASTTVVYQLPSALVARINTEPELVKAAEALDEKLAALVQYIVA